MEIKVGDQVVDIRGKRSVVAWICDCPDCRARGFNEPQLKCQNGDDDCITDYQAARGFPDFYRIGDMTWPEHIMPGDLLDHISDRYDEAMSALSAIGDARLMLTFLMK